MSKYLRKRLSAEQVKEVFERYLSQQIAVEQALAMLKIGRRQFFKLLKIYRERPDGFSLGYPRKTPGRKIDAKSEARIMRELKKEAEIIADKDNPVRFYNYSYLKDILRKEAQRPYFFADHHPAGKKRDITNKGLLQRPTIGKS